MDRDQRRPRSRIVVQLVKEMNANEGFNAQTERYEDLVQTRSGARTNRAAMPPLSERVWSETRLTRKETSKALMNSASDG
jgi:hypothetical protein